MMWKLNILTLCVIASSLLVVEADNLQVRIIGGNYATDVAPHMVSLMTSNLKHFCGGCLLNHRWVLTAEHCLGLGITNIMAGSIHIDRPNVIVRAIREVKHPNHDIGLVQSDRDIPFTNLIQPAGLPLANLPDGNALRLTGWGANRYNDGQAMYPNDMKYLDTFSISQAQCLGIMGGDLAYEKDLCTFKANGHGACFGDSGSPYVNGGRVHAVASRVAPCAIGYPDINTRVFPHVAWINSYINS